LYNLQVVFGVACLEKLPLLPPVCGLELLNLDPYLRAIALNLHEIDGVGSDELAVEIQVDKHLPAPFAQFTGFHPPAQLLGIIDAMLVNE
jgi:hypothetical protein